MTVILDSYYGGGGQMTQYGNGTVYLRKDGRWAAQMRIDGVQRVRYAKSREDAQRRLREWYAELDTVPTPEPEAESPLVAAFAEEWLGSASLSPSTLEGYRNSLRAHIVPAIGSLPLNAVTTPHIAAMIAGMKERGKSSRTTQYAFSVTHRMLEVAVSWGILAENPASRMKRPSADHKARVVWSEPQVKMFIEYCSLDNSPWDDMLLVALLSGLRLGELLGLEWADVDDANATVMVRRSVTEVKPGEFVTKEPKSAAGIRSVSLPRQALDAIRRRRLRSPEAEPAVFRRSDAYPGAKQGIPRRHAVAAAMQRACARAGVPYIGVHGLRHMHVSLLAHAGVSLKAAQQRVGHSSPTVTMAIYTHTIGNADRGAALALDGMLAGRSPEAELASQRRKVAGYYRKLRRDNTED